MYSTQTHLITALKQRLRKAEQDLERTAAENAAWKKSLAFTKLRENEVLTPFSSGPLQNLRGRVYSTPQLPCSELSPPVGQPPRPP
jgi:hypothetical protein